MCLRYHGKERRKETSYINASLMALKECIRARSMGTSHLNQHVFRKSKLTLALKNSFFLPTARTIVIATVSPASKDTEHSLNTLRHACLMNGQEEKTNTDTGEKETRFVTGGKTITEQIGEVNVAKLAKKNFERKKSNNGEMLELKTNNGNTTDSKLARAANKEVEITDKMKRKMMRMSENRSWITLSDQVKRIINESRERIGKDEKQLMRIQGGGRYDNGDGGRSIYELDGYGIIGSARRQEEEEEEQRQQMERKEEEEDDDDNVNDDVETFYNSLRQKDEEFNKQKQKQAKSPLPSTYDDIEKNKNYPTSSYDEDFEMISPRAAVGTGVPHRVSSASRDDDNNSIKPSIAHKTVSKRLSSSSSVDSHDSSSPPTHYTRVPYSKIYDAIFLAKDTIPQAILLMQLRAMLKVHNYTSKEIEELIHKEVKGNNSSNTNSRDQIGSSNISGKIRKEVGRVPSTPTHHSSSSSSYRQMEVITPRSAAVSSSQTPPLYPSSSSSSSSGSNLRPSTPQRTNSRQSLGIAPNSENRAKSNSRGSNGGLSSSFSSSTADQPEITTKSSIYQRVTASQQQQQQRPSSAQRRRPSLNVTSDDDNDNASYLNIPAKKAAIPSSSSSSSSSTVAQKQEQAQTKKEQQKQKEKETKLFEAKLKLEQEVLQKKARQEAAKEYRNEIEKIKSQAFNQKHGNNRVTSLSDSIRAVGLAAEEEKVAQIQQEIDYHTNEIDRLDSFLERDRSTKNADEKLSMAQKFGYKKQIALHKATILKAERRKNELENGGGGGGGGEHDDSDLQGGNHDYQSHQQQQQQQQQQQMPLSTRSQSRGKNRDQPLSTEESFRRSLSRESGIGNSSGGAVIDTGRGGGGPGGSNSFRVNYSVDKQTADPHQQQQKRNLSKNNQRYYGKAASNNSDWTFENNDYHKFYEDDEDHGSSSIPQDQADLPLISERGRPISLRMAQQLASQGRKDQNGSNNSYY
jgi:hypothetical protein